MAAFALGTVPSLGGCSDPNGGGGDEGDDDDNGGTSGTGTGGSANGGSSGSSGSTNTGGTSGSTGTGGTSGSSGTGTGGSSGSGGAMCSNSDLSTLPIDEDGWVAKECNDRGIQGAFYCYDDGVNMTSCPVPAADGTRPPPYRAGGGMCVSGTTTLDPTYAAWGAGIGLSLADSGGMPSVKGPYNATANGVTGFHIDITGSTGMLPLRVAYTGSATPEGAQPFVQFPAGATSLDVPIADALVPESWTTDPNAGMHADPASIFDLQVQITGGDAASTYDFCIAKVTPITNGPPMGGNVPPFGTQQCGNLSTVDLPGKYMVQNNLYNAMGGSQCVTAGWDMGANAGFVVNPVNVNIPPGGAPASYPSVVLGWHYGRFYGSYGTARQLQAITSIPSSWSFTVPAMGRYNASYDAWIHPTNANPMDPRGGVELMIWLNQRDTTPIGTIGPTVMIGGSAWAVWYGPNDGGWTTVSYVRAGNTTSVSNLDLKPFFADAQQRGYVTASSYLLSVQAGFEIWEQNQSMTTNSYSVAIN
jgi:hypothetical protein